MIVKPLAAGPASVSSPAARPLRSRRARARDAAHRGCCRLWPHARRELLSKGVYAPIGPASSLLSGGKLVLTKPKGRKPKCPAAANHSPHRVPKRALGLDGPAQAGHRYAETFRPSTCLRTLRALGRRRSLPYCRAGRSSSASTVVSITALPRVRPSAMPARARERRGSFPRPNEHYVATITMSPCVDAHVQSPLWSQRARIDPSARSLVRYHAPETAGLAVDSLFWLPSRAGPIRSAASCPLIAR